MTSSANASDDDGPPSSTPPSKTELVVAGDFQLSDLDVALPRRGDVEQIVTCLDTDADGSLSVEEVKSLYSLLLGIDADEIPDDHEDVMAFAEMSDSARVHHLCSTMTAKGMH